MAQQVRTLVSKPVPSFSAGNPQSGRDQLLKVDHTQVTACVHTHVKNKQIILVEDTEVFLCCFGG